MNLSDYLAPVRDSIAELPGQEWHPQSFAAKLRVNRELDDITENLEGVKLALVGVVEDRGHTANDGSRTSPDEVRRLLYKLFIGKWQQPMADLGNIYPGESLTDTLVALREVCSELIKKQILPIVIGGTQDLTYAMYRAYDSLEQSVNLVSVDARFDLGQQEENLNSGNFLSHVILKKPYILFNYSHLGYQTYFTNQEEIDLMERMYFDLFRLGTIRNNVQETEPVLRDADLMSFDLSAIKQGDAPATVHGSPNGFSGEEACAICRYAGISDKLSAIGIFENNPRLDENGRSSHLIAQMIWYFVEGYNARKGDYPIASKQEYERYIVLIDEGDHELVFYKSHLSGRWWIEVPMRDNGKLSNERHQLIPCSALDYERACANEIPIRWWQAMKKTL